jgi:hypothetical protein
MEATALSLHLCMVVTKGVKLASRVTVTACIDPFFLNANCSNLRVSSVITPIVSF